MKRPIEKSSCNLFLRILLLAVVMMCGVNNTYAWKNAPTDADLAEAKKFNADALKELIFTYGDYSGSTFYQLYFSDMWHVIREICGEETYNHIYANQSKVNASSIKWGFCENCSQDFYSPSEWKSYYNENAPGANAESAIKNKQDATCRYFWYIELTSGDKYLLTVQYRIKYTQEINILDNELAPDNKTITVGATYSPQAHSTKGSGGDITYYGPFDTYAKAQSATSNSGTVGGRYATSASVSDDAGKTYYFKAVQEKWTDTNKDIPYNTASTVTSVSVVAKKVPKFNGSNETTTVGSYVTLQAYAEDYVYVSSYGGYSWMPITNNESSTTEFGKAYRDEACTQEVSYARQAWNSYMFSEAGTFYVKTTITPSNTDTYTSVSGLVKVTVTPKAYTLKKLDTVNSTIYRSRPDGLDVSKLFSCTADDASTACQYSVYSTATGNVTLNGTTLPDDMAKGTYTISCYHPQTAVYESKYDYVVMKIVGDYVRNVVYTETSGTGTFSFDIHDMIEALGVETIFNVFSANSNMLDAFLYENSSKLEYPTLTGDAETNYGYRIFSSSNLTLKMPNTHYYEFTIDHPDYTITLGDAHSQKKTDFVVDYNRNGNYYTAEGFIFSVINRGTDNTPCDYLRYTVNITNLDPSGFWPVPSVFSQQGGTDITDDIESCPLTLGGSGTYGATAKTCDDADYKTGDHIFSHTTAGTAAASQIVNLIPQQGTYYKFDPQYDDMLLTVGICLPKRKTLMIIDSYGGTNTSMKDLGSGLQGWRDVNGTVTLEAQAGHSYYFYSPDYPLQIFGYEYSRAE